MSELYQHRARKRFGQNFLHDVEVTHRIPRAIHAREGQRLLEISPGQGALTEGLLSSGAHLDVIELDQDLIPLLKLKFGLESCFSLHQGDTLKFNFASLVESGEKLRVVGSLPCSISAPLIFHLLEHAPVIENMYSMLQKEVVERLAATSGGEDWDRLSIMIQYHCRVEHLFNVDPDAFNPPPEVDSAIVRFTPFAESPHPVRDPKLLKRAIHEAFSQYHKTPRNILKLLLGVEDIEAAKVDPTLCPEQLGLATFVHLANRLAELLSSRQSNKTLVRNQASYISDTQHQINVRISTRYPPEQSTPEQNRFTFAYMVTIKSQGEVPAQLLSRRWITTDSDGRTQEVHGAGVVGEQPLTAPDAQHTYTSGTVLTARAGSIRGNYQMLGNDEIVFDTAIPVFRLAVPGTLH